LLCSGQRVHFVGLLDYGPGYGSGWISPVVWQLRSVRARRCSGWRWGMFQPRSSRRSGDCRCPVRADEPWWRIATARTWWASSSQSCGETGSSAPITSTSALRGSSRAKGPTARSGSEHCGTGRVISLFRNRRLGALRRARAAGPNPAREAANQRCWM